MLQSLHQISHIILPNENGNKAPDYEKQNNHISYLLVVYVASTNSDRAGLEPSSDIVPSHSWIFVTTKFILTPLEIETPPLVHVCKSGSNAYPASRIVSAETMALK